MPISENFKINMLCLPHHHNPQKIPMFYVFTNSYLLEIKSLLKVGIEQIAWLLCTSYKTAKSNLQKSEYSSLLFHKDALRMDLTLFETSQVTQILLLIVNSNSTALAKA